MKIPRSTSARATPSSSTRLCSFPGTADLLISSTNTNRLSTDRLYSVSQPAKNCPEAAGCPASARPAPNATAAATTVADQAAASRIRTGPGRRALTTRSAPIAAIRAATVTAQSQGVTGSGCTWRYPPAAFPRPVRSAPS